MPELPEVETIKRGLGKFILHKKLTRLTIKSKSSFLSTIGFTRDFFEDVSSESSRGRDRDSLSGNVLQKNTGSAKMSQENIDFDFVVNAKAVALRRFGKALVIDLDNGRSLMIHLRMTGQLIWRGEENYAGGHPSENFVAELPNKQTRVIFEFEDGKLYFNDQRKFGFVKMLRTDEVLEDTFIRKLAKEPWGMSGEELYAKLQRHKKSPIKAALLDQTIICGLGNIYADEALFFAKVHPETRAGKLSIEDAEKIIEGARTVMERSIEAGGSTMATYVRADGTKGDYLEKFAKVFRREGLACPDCGCKIIKIRVAGRGTHICPKCQEKK